MIKLMFVFADASFYAGAKVHALAVAKDKHGNMAKKRDFVFSAFAYVAVAAIFALVVF